MRDLPVAVLALTIWLYWARVVAMVARMRRRSRSLGGLVPEQARERRMWLVWVPLVTLWIALPTLAVGRDTPPLAVPAWARATPWLALRIVAAIAAVACLLATVSCWRRMGANWSMGIEESRRTELVTEGLFARVRHPIYALSIALMTLSVVVLPTWPMLVIAVVHIALMAMKAANEERYLERVHGDRYRAYCASTGRFLPRARRATAR